MFKRRLAVLGTAAALLLTGLGGSAMADDAPPAGGPTGAVSCTTNDGQAIKIRADVKGRVTVSRNGEVHQEGDVSGLPLPEGEPGKVIKEALPASPSSLPSSPAETFAAVDGVTAVPALPASELAPGDSKVKDPAKTIKIVCIAEKAAEKAAETPAE